MNNRIRNGIVFGVCVKGVAAVGVDEACCGWFLVICAGVKV